MINYSTARVGEFKAVMSLVDEAENVLIALVQEYNEAAPALKEYAFPRVAAQIHKINTLIDLFASTTIKKFEVEIANGVLSYKTTSTNIAPSIDEGM